MHMHEASIGTLVLKQNVPASIFKQVDLRINAEKNLSEIRRTACASFTTCNYISNLNQAMPYKTSIEYIDLLGD